MKAYSQEVLDLLDSGEIVERGMLLFDLPSGLYGFWDGGYDLVHEGITYLPGKVIQVEDATFGSNLASTSLVLRLSAIPDTDLTEDVLATIEQEDYHQRPVTISIMYIHPETREIIGVEREYRGYIDKIEHNYSVGGNAELMCYLESRARDHSRQGHRTRNDEDQKRILSNDKFFSHAGLSGSTPIYWGRLPPSPTGGGSGSSGLFLS